MPRAKKTTTKKVTPKLETKVKEQKEETISISNLAISNNLPKIKKVVFKYWWLGAIVVLLIGLAVLKKGWFVAATVNGTPITNFALQKQLNDTYRTSTLTQMINQQIILDEGRKNNITVTDDDVSAKITSIETNVGGAQALDGLLTQQGQTRASLIDQIKIELIVEKLYASEATVSAAEIDAFVAQNKDQMQSTDSAAQKKEAQDAITQQKISQIYNQKFADLKQKANIQIY